MAQDQQSQLRCPQCDGHDIATDSRYGNKLKGRDFMRRFLKSPVVWIGLLLAALGGHLSSNPGTITNGQWWSIGLVVVGTVLTWIATVPIHRNVYSANNTAQYPGSKYTCRACGHQWTSQQPQAVTSPITETTVSIPSQEAPIETPTRPVPQTMPEDAADAGATEQCQRCGQHVPVGQALLHSTEVPWPNSLLCAQCSAEVMASAERPVPEEKSHATAGKSRASSAFDVGFWLVLIVMLLIFLCVSAGLYFISHMPT